MKKNLKIIITVLAVIAVASAAVLVTDYSRGSLHKDTSIDIPDGAGTIIVSRVLNENGAIRSRLLFRLAMKQKGYDRQWQPGKFEIEAGSGYKEIAEKLTDPVYVPDIKVLIREGLQIPEIAKILSDAGVCGKEEFIEACKNYKGEYPFLKGTELDGRRYLEGYLFPDTYRFFPDTEPDEIISRMLDRFEEKVYTPERIARAEEKGYSFDEIMILASMAESEAVTEQDRKDVSGVFYNRLETTGSKMLQSCVTVEFALGIHKTIINKNDLAVDSPYNTYMYPGLPIGPICCPGLVSIDAALWPAQNDYYYFQSDKFGRLHFAATYAEHAAIQKEVQKDWTVKVRKVGE